MIKRKGWFEWEREERNFYYKDEGRKRFNDRKDREGRECKGEIENWWKEGGGEGKEERKFDL